MLELISVLLIAGGSLVFALRRTLRYLRCLQQEEYHSRRFLSWVRENRAFDHRGSWVAFIAALLHFYYTTAGSMTSLGLNLIGAFFLGVIVFREEDPRTQGKITLKMTARAKRIYRTSILIYAVFLSLLVLASVHVPSADSPVRLWLANIILFQCIPLFLGLAVTILRPGENALQMHFLVEAKEHFASVDPLVIGITGSYGKTSTKAILGKLLDVTLGPTFWPQKGVNTLMGITREIREKLRSSHRYAVIEMAAYQRGSIAKLCELTPPRGAIITAVGLMHLERFGSPENVYLAKSELAQAVPEDGILVCNGDNAGARRMAEEYRKAQTLLYGLDRDAGELDCWISNVSFSAEGTSFVIHYGGEQYPGFTMLHGKPALSNMLGAFTLACSLGADPQYALATIRNLQPVDNRLQVQQYEGVIQLNDAYNSNPVGFAAALEVMEGLPGKRRILITPGMIEFGEEQEKINETAGEQAAKVCDQVFIVGHVNREPLRRGLIRGGFDQSKIKYFEHRDLALVELAQMRSEGDVILLENDLSDLFEMDLRF